MRLLPPLLLAAALCACRGDSVHHATETDPFFGPPSPTAIPPGTLVKLGEAVPDFVLDGIDGQQVRLSDLRGNRVVLEWFNPECPFSSFAHEHGVLTGLARELREEGVLWLAINSAGDEKMGGGLEASREAAKRWGMSHPVLVDPTGEVGRMFDATNTPEVFLIDERGRLRYLGAIDNAPFGKVPGGGAPQNYLLEALAGLDETPPRDVAPRQPYGCRIKYAQPVLQR